MALSVLSTVSVLLANRFDHVCCKFRETRDVTRDSLGVTVTTQPRKLLILNFSQFLLHVLFDATLNQNVNKTNQCCPGLTNELSA